LSCNNDCTFNFESCTAKTPAATCGDGSVNQITESCDDSDLKGKTCASFGFSSGTLRCTNTCSYDGSDCANPSSAFCGDNTVQKPNSASFIEQCDGTNLEGKTCTSFSSYSGGLLVYNIITACRSCWSWSFSCTFIIV